MKNLILLPLIVLVALACEKQTLEVYTPPTDREDFYMRLEAKDTMHTAFQPVNYTIGDTMQLYYPPAEQTLLFRFACDQNIIRRDGKLYLRTGIYNRGYSAELNPLFGFEFHLPELQPAQLPTREALKAYFYPGRTIDFGGGPDQVNALMRLDIGYPVTIFASQSAYLFNPTGSLTITKVEDYEYEYEEFPERTLRGLRVECEFHGQIGRYLGANGHSTFPNTNVAVDIRNGKRAFLVVYE